MGRKKPLSTEQLEKLELVRKNSYLNDSMSKHHNDSELITNTWNSIAGILNITGMDGMCQISEFTLHSLQNYIVFISMFYPYEMTCILMF